MQKIIVLQQQINFLICLFFVQFSASVELDIQEEYLTRNLVWLAGDNFVVLNLLPWTKKVQNNHSDICIEWSCDHFGGMSPENCYLGTKMNSLNFWAHFLMKSRYKSSITWGLYFILPSFYSVFLIEQFFLKFPVVKPLDKYCTSNSWFFSNILGVMLFFSSLERETNYKHGAKFPLQFLVFRLIVLEKNIHIYIYIYE